MVTLIEREFVVPVPMTTAWKHLARVEQWPSWAAHIRKIELQPPGELGPDSTGLIHLSNGMRSAFRMTEFQPPRNWKWAGPFLWATVFYDHQFEPLDNKHTKLIWVVEAEGMGAAILGRLFAKIYRRNLEKAVPLLIDEMSRNSASD